MEKVIKTGIHKCLNGKSFKYKVTNYDMERREITGDTELVKRIQSGDIHPVEISRLLFDLYGELKN